MQKFTVKRKRGRGSMTSCRRVLFIVTQDKGSMSLSYEQFKQKKRSNRMKIQKYTHIKKRKEKKLRNGH